MAWTKLDESAVAADQPLSAFVGNRLTANVNTYIKELQRSATFAYPTTDEGAAKVKWASVFGRRGTVITVDCGTNASDFVFKVFYKTTNAAIGGTLYVRDIDAGNTVSVAVPGSASPTSIEVPFLTYGVRGLRGFHISFESDVGDAAGSVTLAGAVGNQVFCEPDGGAFPFTLAVGSYTEMYHVLAIDSSGANPAPLVNGLPVYQVCMFKHNVNAARPPHGVLVVWPEVEINPPIFGTETVAPGSGPTAGWVGNLYELGRLELFSITVEMGWPTNNNSLPPYAYQQPTPMSRLNQYSRVGWPLPPPR